MTARRSTTPAVTLFPFLAVLVCAMGALIFLLLITTRRIRQQSIERAQAVAEVEAETEMPLLMPIPVLPAEPEIAADPLDDEPILPLFASDPQPPLTPPEPIPDLYEERLAELSLEWLLRVETLELQEKQLRTVIAELESSQVGEDRRADLQRTALREAQRQLDQAEERVGSARQNKHTLMLRQSQLEHQIRESEARLQQILDEHAQASGQYEILPYDGQSGTTRRPILIECTETGFNFVSDGVRLTPDDVNGFTPQQNPLLAGTEALMNYWTSRDLNSRSSDSPTGRPYVLLIIRPGGTLAYYVARRLLEPLDEPFGYELVTDQRFVAPDSDPRATAALERAIDYLKRDRERLLARTRGGTLPIADSLRFSDGSGRFYLEEVRRLRENSETVHFGGREVERERAGGGRSPEPRVVEFPPAGSENAGRSTQREPAPTHGTLGPPRGLYDAQVTPDSSHGGSSGQFQPPRRRTFQVDGPVSHAETGERLNDGAGSPAEQSFQLPRRASSTSGRSSSRRTPVGSTPTSTSAEWPRGEQRIDVDNPQWGLRDAGSSIGIERNVTVRIDASEVRVADGKPLPITTGISREQLQRNLAEALDAHVRGWGHPPNSFFWLPAIQFEVAPGGHQYHQRLNELVEEWKLRSNVEFVLE